NFSADDQVIAILMAIYVLQLKTRDTRGREFMDQRQLDATESLQRLLTTPEETGRAIHSGASMGAILELLQGLHRSMSARASISATRIESSSPGPDCPVCRKPR